MSVKRVNKMLVEIEKRSHNTIHIISFRNKNDFKRLIFVSNVFYSTHRKKKRRKLGRRIVTMLPDSGS